MFFRKEETVKTLIPKGEKRNISYKWAAENDKYIQQHVIDVGDVPATRFEFTRSNAPGLKIRLCSTACR